MRLAAILLVTLVVIAPTRAQDRYGSAIARSREAVNQLVASGEAPGVGVAVAVNGAIVWEEGFGFADLERRVPVSTQTRFGLGSLSKTMTMAAAMRLVDKGQLALDDPIERYLPDFPHLGRGITVRRLAVHQSGLSDSFAARHYTTTREFSTLDSVYQEMKAEPLILESAPGSRVAYATGLFTILGRVLEVAAGADYLTIMGREVFGPVGINPRVNNPRATIEHRSAYFARGDNGALELAPVVDPSHKLPGAGFVATASEVARFGAAVLQGRFLSERARAEMFTPVPLADGTTTEWALGLRVASDAHGRVLHLPGGGLGISGWLFLHPEADTVIVLLSNLSTAPVGGEAYRRIAEAFTGDVGSIARRAYERWRPRT